jgi:hypothetical protein
MNQLQESKRRDERVDKKNVHVLTAGVYPLSQYKKIGEYLSDGSRLEEP